MLDEESDPLKLVYENGRWRLAPDAVEGRLTASWRRATDIQRTSSSAIVGDGFGALLTYTTAVYLGFRPEQIGIFGENTNPVQTYQQFAWNLGQTVLRSESESHFLPADWPTFAQMDALARRNPSPLLRSAGRKFNPGVPEILSRGRRWSPSELGYEERVLGGVKVGWIIREPGPPAHFSLYDEDANLLGRCKHAMIAIGHGPLALPGRLRRGARESGDRRPGGAGLRAEAVPRGRPLHRGRARGSPR